MDTDVTDGEVPELPPEAERADAQPFFAKLLAEDPATAPHTTARMLTLEWASPEQIKGDWDDLFHAAAEVCIQNGGGSTSLLQRRLSIGYGRAARIVDQLHDAGVVGPSEGSKPREVLVSLQELDQLFPGT